MEFLRRVEAFCSVMVLAYAIMSNHFHIFIYVPEPVGIRSRIHINRYYLAPMLEKGLVVRTAPEHPNSPHQEYERI